MTLTTRILLAMALGIVLGSSLNLLAAQGWLAEPLQAFVDDYLIEGFLDVIGRIFIASLKLLVVPLVFVSLICGTCSLGDNSRMGPIAGKTLGLYIATNAIAVSVALLLALLVGPGGDTEIAGTAHYVVREAPPLSDVLVNAFPSNPVQAMAEGKMLQVIVFALLVGYAVSQSGEPGQRILAFFKDFEQVIMKMVAVLMALAPYGVFALLTKLFAELGVGAVLDLGIYFATVIAALMFHALGVYSLLLKLFTGLSPAMLYRKMRPVWAFAFSTASSGATLPITMRAVKNRFGVSNAVAGFTVPLGATINMDGTAIMQGVATVFIAQVYGVDLSIIDLLVVVLTATLASVGTAAVPGVGLVTLAMVLEQAGLPVEGIALIIGVDRLLDMVRTAVNVTGDCMVSVIVGCSEGQFDQSIYDDPDVDVMTAAAVARVDS